MIRYGGKETWFSGCVVGIKILKPGRHRRKRQLVYDILYDDGDREHSLLAEYVRAATHSNEPGYGATNPGNLSDEEHEVRRLQEEEINLRSLLTSTESDAEIVREKGAKRQEMLALEQVPLVAH